MNASARQLLVVLPAGRYVPDDAALERLVYELAVAVPPSKTARYVHGTLSFVFRLKLDDKLDELARGLRKLASGEAGPDELTDTAKDMRGVCVRPFLPILKPLLRTLLSVNTAGALPDLRVHAEDDPALASLAAADGRFLTNVVYCAHPGDPTYFVRLADYHAHLLNEKRGEFLRLAAALGAKSIRVVETDAREQKASAELGISDGAERATAKSSYHDRAESEFGLSSEFERPAAGAAPHVPDGLRWLRLEPLWSAMAQVRKDHWQLRHRVVFAYSNDFSVDAKLAARIGSLGLSCGGSFAEARAVRQEYEVEFFSRAEYAG